MSGKQNASLQRIAGVAAAILSAVSATGCATITTGNSQPVTVNTDPPGAICSLSRDGVGIGVVAPTPGTIQIEKDKDTITMTCHKNGYHEAIGRMDSNFQGMTFGNIIFGGLIGVAVDGASGAMHHYPSMITIPLLSETFESSAARDLFFDHRRTTLLEEHDRAALSIRKNCGKDQDCASELEAAKSLLNSGMAALENNTYRQRFNNNFPEFHQLSK